MAGGTLDHSQIAINTLITLAAALGDGPCRVYNSDAAARLSPTRYTYPDATVTCDALDRGRITEIQAPQVIIEVLSRTVPKASTAAGSSRTTVPVPPCRNMCW